MSSLLSETKPFHGWMSKSQEAKYDRLVTDDEAQDEKDIDIEPVRTTTKSSYRYIIAILMAILGLSFVLFVSFFKTSLVHKPAQTMAWTSCGNSTEEAIANGCHFDPMLISWVPDACYTKEPGDEYKIGEFIWYSDAHLTQPMSLEEVFAGNYTHAFTDGSHHDQHCLYTWRKLSIALEKRLPMLDSKTADFHHSTHCAMTVRGVVQDALAEKKPYKGTYSSVPVLFADCVPLF